LNGDETSFLYIVGMLQGLEESGTIVIHCFNENPLLFQ